MASTISNPSAIGRAAAEHRVAPDRLDQGNFDKKRVLSAFPFYHAYLFQPAGER